MSSSSSASPPKQLCYVHCQPCNTILGVCVPGTSLGRTVTVRCGHCSKLISVDTHGYANHYLRLPHPHLPLGALYRSQFKRKVMNIIDNYCLPSREIHDDELPPPPHSSK